MDDYRSDLWRNGFSASWNLEKVFFLHRFEYIFYSAHGFYGLDCIFHMTNSYCPTYNHPTSLSLSWCYSGASDVFGT
jgi:hypothetical protein